MNENIFPITVEENEILHAMIPGLQSGYGWSWCNDYWIEDEEEFTEEDLEDAIERIRGWIDESETEKRLLFSAPDLCAALEAVEWCGMGGWYGCCPSCGEDEEDGHAADCIIGNAIKKARGEG